MPYLVTELELESKLIETMKRDDFVQLRCTYHALLDRLGNVDGDECIALVLIALDELKA